jgi:hypothetical protein
MDLDSLNGGSVDTKGWCNPVVGTLRAKKVICDDIEISGGTVPNLGWRATNLPSAERTILQDTSLVWQDDIEPSTNIPVSDLGVGSVWELYTAGNFSIIGPIGGGIFPVISLGITLYDQLNPTIGDKVGVVTYTNSVASIVQYEYHGTFRVTGPLTPGNLLEVTHVGKLVTKRDSDGNVQTDLNTTIQDLTMAVDTDGKIGVYLCGAATGASFSVKRMVSYLRRIA